VDEATRAYEEVIRLQPGNARDYHAFGCFLRNVKRDYAGAIDCFHRALELDPTSVQFHIELALALRLHGKPNDAFDTLRKALELNPNDVHVHNVHSAMGDALRQQGKLDEAIASYREALALDPKNARHHRDLGSALGLRGMLDEAIAVYQEAIRLQPDKADAHHAFACFLRDIKRDHEGAVACFYKALELDPKNAYLHYDFGQMLHRHGKLDEAAAALRGALRLSPDTANAREALASVLNKLAWPLATHPEPARRDPGRAVQLAREAIELKPQNGNYHNTLGTALYRAGRWNDAIEALKTADQLSAGKAHGPNAFFIAMAHWRLGDKTEARRWYDRAVEWMDKNQPRNEELIQFRSEASELLDLQEKK
jgi:tetratricopeptide (TPR) repeat protein